MAQTALTVVQLKQNNYNVQAGDLNVVPAAMDNVNGNSFVATGKEILVFLNTDTATHTVTVQSVGDQLGRLDASALASYTVPVASGGTSGVAVIEMKQLTGWAVGGGVTLTTSSNLVKILVLREN